MDSFLYRSWTRLASLAAVSGVLLGGAWSATAQFPDRPRPPMPPVPERRASVLKKFDQDGDGRLNDAEREAARKAWAASKVQSNRNERGLFQPPPEIMEEFDRNKDGELDEEEGRTAGETMNRRFTQMRKDYDQNGNGRLDEDEIAAAGKDIDAGKLKGIPKMFLQFADDGPGRRERRGPPGPAVDEDPVEVLRRADRNGDGRLDAAELEAARTKRARLREARIKNSPTPGTPTPTPNP